jgi:hypothetical protein
MSVSKTLGKTYACEKGQSDEPPCPVGYHWIILDDEGEKTTGETLNWHLLLSVGRLDRKTETESA